MAKQVETYIGSSDAVDGRHREFKHAMSEFESAAYDDYYLHEDQLDHGHCLYGLPNALLKLLKNILYTAGITLPRATWHFVRIFLVEP